MIQRLAILASEVFGRSVLISGTEDAPVPDAVPPLTSAELTTFGELVRFARSGITGITFAEWQNLRDDLNGLRQYHGLATPNLTQTAAATKALIRTVAAILRDTP